MKSKDLAAERKKRELIFLINGICCSITSQNQRSWFTKIQKCIISPRHKENDHVLQSIAEISVSLFAKVTKSHSRFFSFYGILKDLHLEDPETIDAVFHALTGKFPNILPSVQGIPINKELETQLAKAVSSNNFLEVKQISVNYRVCLNREILQLTQDQKMIAILSEYFEILLTTDDEQFNLIKNRSFFTEADAKLTANLEIASQQGNFGEVWFLLMAYKTLYQEMVQNVLITTIEHQHWDIVNLLVEEQYVSLKDLSYVISRNQLDNYKVLKKIFDIHPIFRQRYPDTYKKTIIDQTWFNFSLFKRCQLEPELPGAQTLIKDLVDDIGQIYLDSYFK